MTPEQHVAKRQKMVDEFNFSLRNRLRKQRKETTFTKLSPLSEIISGLSPDLIKKVSYRAIKSVNF